MFHNNSCRKCGKTFGSLRDLIIHHEQEHIDFTSTKLARLEQSTPEFLPMSYVLRFSDPEDPAPKPIPKHTAEKKAVNESVISTPIDIYKFGCDPNSNALICASGSYQNGIRLMEDLSPDTESYLSRKYYIYDGNHKKPYACNVPGCRKRYKNLNGVKTHQKTFHKLGQLFMVKKNFTPSSKMSPKPMHVSPKPRYSNIPMLSLLPYPSAQIRNETTPLKKNLNTTLLSKFDESTLESVQSDLIYKLRNDTTLVSPESSTAKEMSLLNVNYSNNNVSFYSISHLYGDVIDEFPLKNPHEVS